MHYKPYLTYFAFLQPVLQLVSNDTSQFNNTMPHCPSSNWVSFSNSTGKYRRNVQESGFQLPSIQYRFTGFAIRLSADQMVGLTCTPTLRTDNSTADHLRLTAGKTDRNYALITLLNQRFPPRTVISTTRWLKYGQQGKQVIYNKRDSVLRKSTLTATG